MGDVKDRATRPKVFDAELFQVHQQVLNMLHDRHAGAGAEYQYYLPDRGMSARAMQKEFRAYCRRHGDIFFDSYLSGYFFRRVSPAELAATTEQQKKYSGSTNPQILDVAYVKYDHLTTGQHISSEQVLQFRRGVDALVVRGTVERYTNWDIEADPELNRALSGKKGMFVTEAIYVTDVAMSTQTKAEFADMKKATGYYNVSYNSLRTLEHFMRPELLFYLPEHIDVPKHTLVDRGQVEQFLKEARVTRPQLLFIKVDDPATKYYGWVKDDVVRLLSDDSALNLIVPETVSYRVVI